MHTKCFSFFSFEISLHAVNASFWGKKIFSRWGWFFFKFLSTVQNAFKKKVQNQQHLDLHLLPRCFNLASLVMRLLLLLPLPIITAIIRRKSFRPLFQRFSIDSWLQWKERIRKHVEFWVVPMLPVAAQTARKKHKISPRVSNYRRTLLNIRRILRIRLDSALKKVKVHIRTFIQII